MSQLILRHRHSAACLILSLALPLAFSLPDSISPERARVFAVTIGGDQDDQGVRALAPGEVVKRELSGGQQHRYRIRMIAGLYLKLVVEQLGIDVAVRLSGPGIKEDLDYDLEKRSTGKEVIPLLAEATGDFLLIVSPSRKESTAGSYRIWIDELRIANDNDRALQDARDKYDEASELLLSAGKYKESIAIFERVLETRERLLEPDHLDIASTLNNLSVNLNIMGDYARAEQLGRRSLAILEKILDPEHPYIAGALDNLANIYRNTGEYARSEQFYRRELEIREKGEGKDHPEMAFTLNNLANLMQDQGKIRESEPLLRRALEIREKALPEDDPQIASSLNALGYNYYLQGRYPEAEQLDRRSLAMVEKTLGKDHPAVAETLNKLAGVYQARGKYPDAEQLFLRVVEIRKKALGVDNPTTAQGYNNLALHYYMQGMYREAEPFYERALAIFEKKLGENHPVTATARNNLATLYQKQGKYAEAERLFKQALAVRERTLDRDHPDIANSLSTLALLYSVQRRNAEAESLYRRALQIWEKSVGKNHPDTATSLTRLAVVYREQGRYAEAEPLAVRALEIYEKELGKDNPSTAMGLTNLAALYYVQKRYAEAEPLFRRALAIRENSLGNEHPETANSRHHLALLYLASGDLARAVKFQSLANQAYESNLARNLVTGSERDKLAYLATLSEQTDQTISLHLKYAPADRLARNQAATLILQRKGRVLDATSQNLNTLRSRFNPEDQELLDRLTETRRQIAKLGIGGTQKLSAEQYRARLAELESQAEKDAADISRRSEEFRVEDLPVTLEGVRAAIPPDAALIEFAAYRPYNVKAAMGEPAFGRPRYLAYIIGHQGEIQWKELGDARAIDAAIAAFRKALRNPYRLDVKRLARAVDAILFQPLRPLLGGLTRVLISPDGSLNLIPFEALVDERGRYAVERYSISYLTSGRDLLRLQASRQSKTGPLVVAGPEFGRRAQGAIASRGVQLLKESARAGSAFQGFYFNALPEAELEGKIVSSILPGSTLLTKRQATKAALTGVRSPLLLHIATHGFFLEDQQPASPGDRGAEPFLDSRQLEERGLRLESPLLRSGLVLAGANEEKEDGILTALEVTGMNLWGTKLVVLSACDTGVGEVKNGDGVHGLRRALVLAGAETQVMSLWAVSDDATRELMVSYYRKLQQGQGRGDALRQVQLEMLKQARRRHPFYWATFIQSGEWANLEGKR